MAPVKVFYSYAHLDETLRNELDRHLKILVREGAILPWHDRQIGAGEEWKNAIDENLERAQIILLLVSPDFIASDYCYDIEMKRALERHASKEDTALVIPIILRPCHWQSAPFSKLQALPKDAKPVTTWTNRDEVWLDVVLGIRRAVERLRNSAPPPASGAPESVAPPTDAAPREARQETPPASKLHQRCDRDKQQDEFIDALREHQRTSPHRPFLCLIHGQRFDCHDDFVARLRGEILPRRVAPQIRGFHWTAPPAPLSSPEKFMRRFDEDWLKTNSASVAESRARIEAELTKLNGPLLVRWQWHSDDFGAADGNGLRNFLNFWQTWPDLPAGRLVICALALVYGEPKAAPSGWRFWQKPSADPLPEWVAQLAAPAAPAAPSLWSPADFSLKVLERLPLVPYAEVARWCSDDEVKRVRDLSDEVIEIFKCSNEQPIQMSSLAKVLKRLLVGEKLSDELLAYIQKRS